MRIIINSKTNKSIKLSAHQIAEIKQNHRYEKVYKKNFEKAKRRIKEKNYFKERFLKDLLVVFISSFLTTLGMNYFVLSTGDAGLFPGGLATFARFAGIVVAGNKNSTATSGINSANLFFIFLFLINLPFFVFGFFKVGTKFTLLSMLYIFVSILWDQIIARIPYINPKEFALIVDYKLVSTIPSEWTSAVWLFIFSIFGGVFLGASYSLTYKIGSSTAGTDFISYYVAKKYNKQIGSINMKINLAILALAVVLNTIILPMHKIDANMKYSALHALDQEKFNQIYQAALNSKTFSTDPGNSLYLPTNWTTSSQNFTKDDIARVISSNYKFENYNNLTTAIKIKFIFGPCLFASFILMIIQGIVIDRIYPKNRIITILINTAKPEELKNFLFELGYKNNINFIENHIVRKDLALIKQSVVMISISLVDWKILEDKVLKLDPNMNIAFIKNMKVKGHFNYALDNEKQEMVLYQKVVQDKRLMHKIEQDSIIIAKQKIDRDLKKSKNSYQKNNP
ncbi:YitT family ABC transporter [Mycoplasma putrefaciens]|uniref:YitT family ABC transporter n=1 Tax=Mycoplasma putrefaciens TaxID=2123 RepID=UPI003DA40F10